MSLPSNGITAEIIREAMPPYHLSADLLDATVATLCPPPRGASEAWYEAMVLRVAHDISTLMPANAAQAAMASDIVIARYMANTLFERSHDRALTGPQVCRMCSVADGMKRTAGVLVRTLQRTQRDPAPFFGTVLADEVDVVALAAAWRERRVRAEADLPHTDPSPLPWSAPRPKPTRAGGEACAAIRTPGAGARDESADIEHMQLSATPETTAAEVPARQSGSAEAAACVETDARSTVEGVVTRLNQGSGWSLEVVRPRVAVAAVVGAPAMTAGVPGEISDSEPMQLSASPAGTTAPGQPGVTSPASHDVDGGRQVGVAP